MRIQTDPLHIAIDGNEANVAHRVGSNVYAFELLTGLEEITRKDPTVAFTILLAQEPITELPVQRKGWKYLVIGPKKFWTQWALPIHLFQKRSIYDLFFTPGHYAPRLCPIPYMSSVMDTAYLDFPLQFTTRDRVQLTNWTRYSVKNAAKVLAISNYTKECVMDAYHKRAGEIVVAYPAIQPIGGTFNAKELETFYKKHNITEPYFLFVGTLQPRKNIERLLDAYEVVMEKLEKQDKKAATSTISKKKKDAPLPKLVLAGKVGWLADSILQKIKKSPYAAQIVTTGFVSEDEKKALYAHAEALILIGLHEGFGIPPLEAMKYGTIPLVANTTSLPEVVGQAGITVDPEHTAEIADRMWQILHLKAKERAMYLREGREQVSHFSWESSAKIVLEALLDIAEQKYHGDKK